MARVRVVPRSPKRLGAGKPLVRQPRSHAASDRRRRAVRISLNRLIRAIPSRGGPAMSGRAICGHGSGMSLVLVLGLAVGRSSTDTELGSDVCGHCSLLGSARPTSAGGTPNMSQSCLSPSESPAEAA
jgi:hypothetical protein